MISEQLLFELFGKEVERLGPLSGLSAEDVKRIVGVFKEAVRNAYMDERLILNNQYHEAGQNFINRYWVPR